jgi:hypothetical protein
MDRSYRGYYPFPKSYRYLLKTDLDLWDVIYYLATQRGSTFTTTTREICHLMTGGRSRTDRRAYETARRAFMDRWKEAEQAGKLIEETPVDDLAFDAIHTDESGDRYTYRGAGREYHFCLPGYPPDRHYILKPLGYVEQGWIFALGTAFAKRMLNFLLSLPHLHLDASAPSRRGYESSLIIRQFRQQMWEQALTRVNYNAAASALRLLEELGLVLCADDQCLLNMPALAVSPELEQALISFREEGSERVEFARTLVILGSLEITALPDIFRTLHRFPDPETLDMLRRKVYAHRNEAFPRQRWQTAKKALQRELRRRRYVTKRVSSAPVLAFDLRTPILEESLGFEEELDQAVTLEGKYPIVSARLVCRCRTQDWKLFQPELEKATVMISLNDFRGDPLLEEHSFEVDSETEEVVRSVDLTRSLQRVDSLRQFTLRGQVDPPVSWLRMNAYLELALQR